MIPEYIEIATETLEKIYENKNLLDDIIYKGHKVLSDFDLVSFEQAETIFSALSKFIENSSNEKNQEQQNDCT